MQPTNTTYRVNGNVSLDHTQKRVPPELIDEILKALSSVKGYGSIEIYVQGHSVTQITVRNIKKTKHILAE